MKDMRMGTFGITQETIEQYPNSVREVMGMVIVIEADNQLFQSGVVKYTAISPKFDKLKSGEAIPEYEIIINTTWFVRSILKRIGIKDIGNRITFKRRK